MATDWLNALGASGSGLNIRELATSLVTADTAVKRTTAEKKIEATEVSISALGKVRAQFQSLSEAIGTVTQSSVLKATSSSSALSISVTDRTLVSEQVTEIEVLQVAQRQVLEFGGFPAADAALGAGRITIDFGVWYAPEGSQEATSFAQNPALASSSIDVGDGATLQDLATALSDIPGVVARVLDKGDGTFSLGVVSEPGAGSALRFTVAEGTAGNGLARFDTTATNLDAQVQAATDTLPDCRRNHRRPRLERDHRSGAGRHAHRVGQDLWPRGRLGQPRQRAGRGGHGLYGRGAECDAEDHARCDGALGRRHGRRRSGGRQHRRGAEAAVLIAPLGALDGTRRETGLPLAARGLDQPRRLALVRRRGLPEGLRRAARDLRCDVHQQLLPRPPKG